MYSSVRNGFLDFFAKNNHVIRKSSSLIPSGDNSLLFANSGMVQFKNWFLNPNLAGEQKNYTTVQKCVRAGGKHNDLDNVGYTARHHTFFEMLGNFSFGEYFKEKAIFYAWKFLTEELQLNKEKLYITVYHEDDEAAALWKKIADLPEDRIIKISTDDNFWSMGDTGPCGPCSEIYYDYGDGVTGGKPGTADADGDRYVEIWNLVFMQYEKYTTKDGDHLRRNIAKPCIDTGMGLERIVSVLEGKTNNYSTSLFAKIIANIAQIYQIPQDDSSALKVLADHARSACFLIADGVLPSNEGRGYVLRRIMRRAMRYAHQIDSKNAKFSQVVNCIIGEMSDHYKELEDGRDLICSTVKLEEFGFKETLSGGLSLLEKELQSTPNRILSGALAFKLYDTYGFPLDLTVDIGRQRGFAIDQDGFDVCMDEQKNRSKQKCNFSDLKADGAVLDVGLDGVDHSNFVGYDSLYVGGTKILKLFDANFQSVSIIKGESGCDDANHDLSEDILLSKGNAFSAEVNAAADNSAGDFGMQKYRLDLRKNTAAETTEGNNDVGCFVCDENDELVQEKQKQSGQSKALNAFNGSGLESKINTSEDQQSYHSETSNVANSTNLTSNINAFNGSFDVCDDRESHGKPDGKSATNDSSGGCFVDDRDILLEIMEEEPATTASSEKVDVKSLSMKMATALYSLSIKEQSTTDSIANQERMPQSLKDALSILGESGDGLACLLKSMDLADDVVTKNDEVLDRSAELNGKSIKLEEKTHPNPAEILHYILKNYPNISKEKKLYGYAILNETPFYPQGGGQESDIGFGLAEDGVFAVGRSEGTMVFRCGEAIVHPIFNLGGSISVGGICDLYVCPELYRSTCTANEFGAGNGHFCRPAAVHHTATHLLQAALKLILPNGKTIMQRGSLVAERRLTFDFNYNRALLEGEICAIESYIADVIARAYGVETKEMSLDEALALGAVALFEGKYSEKVRVVSIGHDVSIELCGGTHVKNTAQIRQFKIVREFGVAAGVRRIEAVAGIYAEELIRTELAQLVAIRKAFNIPLASDLDEYLQQITFINSAAEVKNTDQTKYADIILEKFKQEEKKLIEERSGHFANLLQNARPIESLAVLNNFSRVLGDNNVSDAGISDTEKKLNSISLSANELNQSVSTDKVGLEGVRLSDFSLNNAINCGESSLIGVFNKSNSNDGVRLLEIKLADSLDGSLGKDFSKRVAEFSHSNDVFLLHCFGYILIVRSNNAPQTCKVFSDVINYIWHAGYSAIGSVPKLPEARLKSPYFVLTIDRLRIFCG